MQTKQCHLLIEAARGRKGRAHMQLPEFTIKISPSGADAGGRNG